MRLASSPGSWRRKIAAVAVGSVATAGLAVAPATTASAAVSCDVTYKVLGQWPSGFQGDLTIKNTGDAWTSWNLTFSFANGQTISQLWGGKYTQSGAAVTVSNEAWNGALGTGSSANAGFIASWNNTTNALPTSFAVNGVTCGGVVVNPTTTTTRPTTTTTTTTTTTRPTTTTTTTVPTTTTTTRPTTTTTRPTTTTTTTVPTTTTTTRPTTTTTRPTTTTTTTVPTTTTTTTTRPTTTTTTTTVPTTTTTTTTRPTSTTTTGTTDAYTQAFLALYTKIHDPANGYFSPQGIPYHSVETLIVEAPDHGHETTSEAFSYYLWLEANYGRITGNWTPFNTAWTTLETYIIPSAADYPFGGYTASKPATYASEYPYPDQYPSALNTGTAIGADPLYSELTSTYGTTQMYAMHWIIDVDNTYGFGKCGDGTTKPAYINTFQRGTQESVFETVTHPSCDTFKHGNPTSGFLSLFTGDSSYAKQWKFTDAPDADARAVQVAYWALQWAKAQGKQSSIAANTAKAAKMGDYLRYAMYDKYFKVQGCTSPSCAGATGKNSSAYLLNWYFAWGGALDGAWGWRIGASHNHGGYQNPFAAWALSNVAELTPLSATAKADWATSLTRQLDFMTWLQSSEGAIAGGATNSWGGAYGTPPSGTPTFYGMAYEEAPVYSDPPSNQWFGFQAWGVERVAEYYYVTGDAKAKALLDKWVAWALANTTISGTTYQIPSTLGWSGAPGGNWAAGTTSVNNAGLHVTVKDYTNDVGVAGSYAKLLTYYAAKSGNAAAKTAAKGIIDGILAHSDAKGFSVAETRSDYNRFDDTYNASTHQGLFVPAGYTGTMPNGDVVAPGKSFLDIRTFYKNDADWAKVQTYLNGGAAPTFTYHRFWAQVDIATAFAAYGELFPNG